MKSQTKTILISTFLVITIVALSPIPGLAAEKPNILVIWGDDIGITNISAHSITNRWRLDGKSLTPFPSLSSTYS